MKEISEYIELLEDRHKAYIRLIDKLFEEIVELEKRVEELEKK